jgi:DNA-binding NarL/FixJ family response regulator
VHRASRISSAGHGGQVLLSPRTAELAGCDVQDLGRYELAGLPEPEQVFQLVADELPSEFPPLRRARRVDDRRLRVSLADDSVLLREGIARLLEEAGMLVVSQAGTGDELLEQVSAFRPDVAVVDIRMPPSGSDEGLRAAKTIRRLFPGVGVLLLSQALEPAYARELLATGDEGVGYLLKDRVADMQPSSPLRRPTRPESGDRPCQVILEVDLDEAVAGVHPRPFSRPRGRETALRGRLDRADEAQQALERRGVELAAVAGEGGEERELAPRGLRLALHAAVVRCRRYRSFRANAARAAPPTSRRYAAVHGHRNEPAAWAPPKGPSWSANSVNPLSSAVIALSPSW